MSDEKTEMPMSMIILTAPVGSSVFDIRTENCDPIQLFGAGHLLQLVGEEAFADMRAQQMAASASPIVIPSHQRIVS